RRCLILQMHIAAGTPTMKRNLLPVAVCSVALTLVVTVSAQQPEAKPNAERRRANNKPAGVGPAIKENKATPIDRIKTLKDFKAELLYSAPGQDQGSWVNLCVDNKNRIIVSDQYGGLYRFPAPPAGEVLDPAKIEKVPAEIRAVNGMVWAFGALYVGVNDYEKKIPSGLYRLTDSD